MDGIIRKNLDEKFANECAYSEVNRAKIGLAFLLLLCINIY